MYEVRLPSQGSYYFSYALAELADRAWRGYGGPDNLNWRKRYYADLTSDLRIADASFRIITDVSERENCEQDCAFLSVLPLLPERSRAHTEGILSQYDFTAADLGISYSRSKKSFHYVQSVFMEPAHQHSMALKRLFRECLMQLLRQQRCGFSGRPFRIYAEVFLEAGQSLAISQGLRKTQMRSKEGKPFYVYDSERDGSELRDKIASLWTPRKKGGQWHPSSL